MTAVLATLELRHLPELYELTMQPAIRRDWRSRGRLWSPAEFENRVLSGAILTKAAILPGSGRAVGLFELVDYQPVEGKAHFGVVLDRSLTQPSDAARLSIEFLMDAFSSLHLRKVLMSVLTTNDRLTAGLKRHLVREAHFREEILVEGEFRDIYVFALWRADLERIAQGLRVPTAWADLADLFPPGDDPLLAELDSLGWLELHAQVEAMVGRDVPIESLAAMTSLSDVMSLVGDIAVDGNSTSLRNGNSADRIQESVSEV